MCMCVCVCVYVCVCVSSVYSFLGRNTGSWDYLGRECFSIPSLQSKIFNGNAKELPPSTWNPGSREEAYVITRKNEGSGFTNHFEDARYLSDSV